MPSAPVATVNERTRIRTNALFSAAGTSVAQDPSIVKLITRAPGAPTVTTYVYNQPGSPITRGTAGEYSAFLTLNEVGRWWISWVGEGNFGPVVVGEVMVRVLDAVNV